MKTVTVKRSGSIRRKSLSTADSGRLSDGKGRTGGNLITENGDMPEKLQSRIDNSPRVIAQKKGFEFIGSQQNIIAQTEKVALLKSGRTKTIEEFGHKFRNLDVDPEASGDKGVYKGSARPDDAPIVDAFRESYNQLENWYNFIEKKHPDIWALLQKKFPDQRKELIKSIKAKTKEYKKSFRNLDELGVEKLQRNYIKFVMQVKSKIDKQIKSIRKWYKKTKNIKKISDKDLESQVHEQGTDIWRSAWHNAIYQVNKTLKGIWPDTKEKLKTFVDQKKCGDREKIGGLDYIGSLAKGYKGPPKQHIRFNPKDFDVDANLEAPPLSNYAQKVDRQKPDRERIFGRNTSIQPLIDFSNKADDELEKNVHNYKKDPSDPFDVALVTKELPEQERGKNAIESLYQIREKLDSKTYRKIVQQLAKENLLEKSDGHFRLPEELSSEQESKLNSIIGEYT